MIWFYLLIFFISVALVYFSSQWLVASSVRIARFLGWREFVLAFFVMAFAASLPNLFVGISSALHKIPQLSFGEVVGGNVVDLTLAIALATLFAKGGIPAESRTVQTTSAFTFGAAVLPLLLILDGNLSRLDGVLLIAFLLLYLSWLFAKKERFTRVRDDSRVLPVKRFKNFLKDLAKVSAGVILLLAAAEGIVVSASFFAGSFNISLATVGILIVGLANVLPETYFSIASARKGETWMILGNLMGAVIVPATLVLGIVALIRPIEISDFSPFAVARFFLIISALFFFFFVRSGQKITKKEAVILLLIYFAFVATEVIIG